MRDLVHERVNRIYAAIEATMENDLTKFTPVVISTKKMVGFYQDFAGGQSPPDLENAAQLLIHNVASLYDHLKKWAKDNGKDKEKVKMAFNGSLPIQIIYDLWNRDKHGGEGRESWSKKSPQLGEVHGALQISTPPGKASVWMPSVHGNVIQGGGSACRIITGEIRGKDGAVIGQLHPMILDAVSDWEKLLVEFGFNLSN